MQWSPRFLFRPAKICKGLVASNVHFFPTSARSFSPFTRWKASRNLKRAEKALSSENWTMTRRLKFKGLRSQIATSSIVSYWGRYKCTGQIVLACQKPRARRRADNFGNKHRESDIFWAKLSPALGSPQQSSQAWVNQHFALGSSGQLPGPCTQLQWLQIRVLACSLYRLAWEDITTDKHVWSCLHVQIKLGCFVPSPRVTVKKVPWGLIANQSRELPQEQQRDSTKAAKVPSLRKSQQLSLSGE